MPSSVAALILAAGASERFGTPKQLFPFQGRSLLRCTVDLALSSQAHEVLVILGFGAERMKEELSGLPVRDIVNTDWKEGISSSIRAGVTALSATTEAALIMVCDQPLISVEILNTIIAAHEREGKNLVASDYGTVIGVPALFGREYFPELLRLSGDRGARELLLRHRAHCGTVPFPDGAKDIDTLDDVFNLSRSNP